MIGMIAVLEVSFFICLARNEHSSMGKIHGFMGVCLFILFFDYLWIVVIASSITVPGDGWCSRSNKLSKALLDAELFLCQAYYEYLSIHCDFLIEARYVVLCRKRLSWCGQP